MPHFRLLLPPLCCRQDEVPNQVAAGKVLLQPPAGSAHHPLIVVAVRKHLPQHG